MKILLKVKGKKKPLLPLLRVAKAKAQVVVGNGKRTKTVDTIAARVIFQTGKSATMEVRSGKVFPAVSEVTMVSVVKRAPSAGTPHTSPVSPPLCRIFVCSYSTEEEATRNQRSSQKVSSGALFVMSTCEGSLVCLPTESLSVLSTTASPGLVLVSTRDAMF